MYKYDDTEDTRPTKREVISSMLNATPRPSFLKEYINVRKSIIGPSRTTGVKNKSKYKVLLIL